MLSVALTLFCFQPGSFRRLNRGEAACVRRGKNGSTMLSTIVSKSKYTSRGGLGGGQNARFARITCLMQSSVETRFRVLSFVTVNFDPAAGRSAYKVAPPTSHRAICLTVDVFPGMGSVPDCGRACQLSPDYANSCSRALCQKYTAQHQSMFAQSKPSSGR